LDSTLNTTASCTDYPNTNVALNSEYHGELSLGAMSGYGRYLFGEKHEAQAGAAPQRTNDAAADGDGAAGQGGAVGEFRGIFADGLPVSGYFFDAADNVRRFADYAARLPGRALWEMSPAMLVHVPSMPESPLAPYIWSKADCLAVVRQVDASPDAPTPVSGGAEAPRYSVEHIRPVSARLVWARPVYADQPLWNAEEVRGKIVAVMRGPRAPGPVVPYAVKLYYCQEAGAAGIVVVDFENKYSNIPITRNGPIWPGGPVLEMKTPAMMCPFPVAGALQEGAVHQMLLMRQQEQEQAAAASKGWFVGFVVCERQESRRGMSKEMVSLPHPPPSPPLSPPHPLAVHAAYSCIRPLAHIPYRLSSTPCPPSFSVSHHPRALCDRLRG
jgi:hypothetical protein